MRKKIFTTLFITFWAVSVSGCGTSDTPPSGNTTESEQTEVLYSNLTDQSSRDEVVSALQSHGVSQAQTDTLLAWTDDFNSRVTEPALPEGFVSMPDDYVDYSTLLFDYKELPDGTIFPEANCRLTAFLLMKNAISTNGSADESDTYLMFDIEAIDTIPEYQMDAEDRANFITLFHAVSVDGADTQEEHIAKIQAAWDAWDIGIDSNAGISLIEVYLHSTFDNVRFVGHTGVLLETENGLLFVEKYGPRAPFQATKFKNRGELTDYLLARPDLYGDENELPPIVLENGQPINE